MLKIIVGFVGGVLYGSITAVEVPSGVIAKAAAILKMIFFG
jgi:hypothetical protein